MNFDLMSNPKSYLYMYMYRQVTTYVRTQYHPWLVIHSNKRSLCWFISFGQHWYHLFLSTVAVTTTEYLWSRALFYHHQYVCGNICRCRDVLHCLYMQHGWVGSQWCLPSSTLLTLLLGGWSLTWLTWMLWAQCLVHAAIEEIREKTNV